MREKPSWTLLFVFWPQFSIFVLQKKPRPDKKFLIFWLSPGFSSVIPGPGPFPVILSPAPSLVILGSAPSLVILSSAPSLVILSSGGAKNLSPGPEHRSFAALRMTERGPQDDKRKKQDGCNLFAAVRSDFYHL